VQGIQKGLDAAERGELLNHEDIRKLIDNRLLLVRWAEPAARDFTQICGYYLKGRISVSVARRVALAIYQRIGDLTEFPESERQDRKSGTRELMLAPLPYVVVPRLKKMRWKFSVSFTARRIGSRAVSKHKNGAPVSRSAAFVTITLSSFS
jgi:plasmid stabilization system protein ParE